MFAVFASDEDTLSISIKTTDDQITQWKDFVKTISSDQRSTLFSKLKDFYSQLPSDVQDKIADTAANFIDRNVQITTSDAEADQFALQEDPSEEFICGGLCIGLGVVAIGALAKLGYDSGARNGKKADPVIHQHYHDDDMGILPWKKLLEVFNITKEAAQNLFTDSNPGKHTHIYHYDDDEALNINVPALKEWIAKWRAMSPAEKERQKEIMKTMWNNMSSSMQDYYKSQMRSLLEIQNSNPEEDAFVCGGVCISLAVVAGIGIFKGAYDGGKENNQRHEHHHYKKK